MVRPPASIMWTGKQPQFSPTMDKMISACTNHKFVAKTTVQKVIKDYHASDMKAAVTHKKNLCGPLSIQRSQQTCNLHLLKQHCLTILFLAKQHNAQILDDYSFTSPSHVTSGFDVKKYQQNRDAKYPRPTCHVAIVQRLELQKKKHNLWGLSSKTSTFLR